jgi:hypothetical protein
LKAAIRCHIIALVVCAVTALAQTQSATVRGLVFDPSGRPVPNSTITVRNIDQKRDWQTLTNDSGAYNLPQLPPGPYMLRATAPGFKAQERTDLLLHVAQVAEVNLTLSLGDVAEVVSVTVQTPLLEAGTSSLGEVVNSLVTTALPLNGRNSLQLISLVPGVNVTPSFRTASVGSANSDAVAFNINGGRNLQNMILLDGSPQEVPAFNEAAFVPPPDAVQEFKVHTNTPPAEYGRTAGGVINIVHRSGSSAFHGSAYEFFRNDKLDANNFFANRNRRARRRFATTRSAPLLADRCPEAPLKFAPLATIPIFALTPSTLSVLPLSREPLTLNCPCCVVLAGVGTTPGVS